MVTLSYIIVKRQTDYDEKIAMIIIRMARKPALRITILLDIDFLKWRINISCKIIDNDVMDIADARKLIGKKKIIHDASIMISDSAADANVSFFLPISRNIE